MNRLRGIRSRIQDETGSISAYVLMTVVTLIVVTGLVVDSAGKYQQDARAQQLAGNAARSAVNSLNDDTLIAGALTVTAARAQNAARDYIAAAGVTGTVTVEGQAVTVEVDTTYTTRFLSLIGINTLPGQGSATAQLITE